ncbi:ParB N-terminal domain-containing protein [Falsirhodobacter halotolerans]|uniref:ParB N-terminal domain-containing protein n=1 Tax=Falsirhodobacter halotolerans TaxID=1146892 RepID=UPI001FD5221C|nr:ParB N-terminal domain-containing protein [Falsirhodobacter halotolerans]MCJ8139587.1 ParB N-terminal domain-containing protein [Falsirhodobacter halotolerans]
MTHYRHVSVEGLQPVVPASQPAPQLLWVSVTDLVIDDRYQRPLAASNLAAIRRIAADFQWSRFSPVIVAPVLGGKFALIDGQHRAHAAALCGYDAIPAMVALVQPEEQALAFIEINTRQIRVGQMLVYRAALTAGEPWAVACHDAVAAANCQLMTVNWSSNKKKPRMVFAVGLIRKLIEDGKGKSVTSALSALAEYEPDSVANFSDALLSPWINAAAETAASAETLLAALRLKRPWIVIEVADRVAKQEGQAKALARRAAFVSLIRRAQSEGEP